MKSNPDAVAANQQGVTRAGKWRAVVLIVVNVAIVAHIIQWKVSGRTLSPVEPSEAVYTISDGEVNAGAIFFAVALLATVVVGRFFCGWACHVVALQDFCGYLMKKIRIRPHAFRSRFLYHAPFALAFYMFIWPVLYRWWVGADAPEFRNHIMTTDFWATFPGPWMAFVTLLIVGFIIVYVLGAKAFCTYGCPYGGFFAPLDKLAPGKIRVTDDCEHCGHCTASCTSNVRVHEEVARFGMVVDPGCMKCMDCVSTCPNDALYFGFGKPSLGAKPASPPKTVPYEFSLAEEIAMLVIGLFSLFVFRGLYNAVPLLLTMGIAAIIAYCAIKCWRLVSRSHLKLQNLQLKKAGKITRAGIGYAAFCVLLFLFTGHSAYIQYHVWQSGNVHPNELPDAIWRFGNAWWSSAPADLKTRIDDSIDHHEAVLTNGFFPTPMLMQSVVPLYLARGEIDKALDMANQRLDYLPGEAESYIQLASVLQTANRHKDAEATLQNALETDPCSVYARNKLGSIYEVSQRFRDALALFEDAEKQLCDHMDWNPRKAQVHLNIGVSLMRQLRPEPGAAATQFQAAVDLTPENPICRKLLADALFNDGQIDKAHTEITRAIALDENDPVAYELLSRILARLGDIKGAQEARQKAQAMMNNMMDRP